MVTLTRGSLCQAAALAEFRADWATAVKTYIIAYGELGRIIPGGSLPLQRWAELTAVAELIHLKVCMLALFFDLHSLGRLRQSRCRGSFEAVRVNMCAPEQRAGRRATS